MTPKNMKTPEQRKRIADYYRQGFDTREIKGQFGIGWTTLYKILAEFNVPRRKGRPSHP